MLRYASPCAALRMRADVMMCSEGSVWRDGGPTGYVVDGEDVAYYLDNLDGFVDTIALFRSD